MSILLGPQLGLLRQGTIRRFNPSNGTMTVAMTLSKSDANTPTEKEVPIAAAWSGPSGEFSGGCPEIGSTVWCAQGQGEQWSALTFVPSDDIFGNRNTSSTVSPQRNAMNALRPGRWLTQVRNNIRVFADPTIGIQAGNPREFIHLDPNKSIFSNSFKHQLGFSDASTRIDGIVKRDIGASKSARDITGSALKSHAYDRMLHAIALDPKTRAGGSLNRNPPFNEVREIVYEFSNSFGFRDDSTEADIYDNDDAYPEITTDFNRRTSRADALSLSLIYPNQLIEEIKGTAVDVYGNLLDINRHILPSGRVNSLSFRDTENDKSETFIRLREQARKTIAYHMEINTRNSSIFGFDDIKASINNPTDYARNRSKFFIDIDKEGQFKWNVPASSEVGNVPLLVRYENYTTLKSIEDDLNPNKFRRNNQNQDIFLESYGQGVISLVGGEDNLDRYTSPTDRRESAEEPIIKLGTAYHDIQKTLEIHNLDANVVPFDETNTLNSLSPIGDIVSPEIVISGPNANAGGRSGTINLDGFLSFNIGSNTVDRQSLWLDLAGGAVTNYGRDLNNRSLQSRFDGDIFIQVGGATVSNDSRFDNVNDANRDNTVDIRVLQSGNMMTIVRIDNLGVRIATPGDVEFESMGKMLFKSRTNRIILDAEEIYLYQGEGSRLVTRNGTSI